MESTAWSTCWVGVGENVGAMSDARSGSMESSGKRGGGDMGGDQQQSSGGKGGGGGCGEGGGQEGSLHHKNRRGSDLQRVGSTSAWETSTSIDRPASPLVFVQEERPVSPKPAAGAATSSGAGKASSSLHAVPAFVPAAQVSKEEGASAASSHEARIVTDSPSQSSGDEAKWQKMIALFDRKHPGITAMHREPAAAKGEESVEEEVDVLLGYMMGEDHEKVAEAAVRLREIVTGDDASTAATRIKLLAKPLALEAICQSIVEAQEVWEVIYAYGVSVRAAPNQKSTRIGNIPLGDTFAVTTMSFGWLKLKRPPAGQPEGWVRIGPAGKEQVQRHSEDAGKIAAMELLLELVQLRHLCLELPRRPQLTSTLAFISTIAPQDSQLHDVSKRLLNQLRLSRTLLNGWPVAPGHRVSIDRSMHTSGYIRAPELHALRTIKTRRPPTPTGPSSTSSHKDRDNADTESAQTRHARLNASQPEGWYGTGIHSIIAPPPVTSLRAYTSGIRLPITTLESKKPSRAPGGPLHVSSHVSTFDWAMT